MGYPMTFQRLLNRNRLSQGDYDHQSLAPYPHVGLDEPLCGYQDVAALERAYRTQFRITNDERLTAKSRLNMILGDLRRLERDAVDEGTLARVVAEKAHLDLDIVAAVIKEFLAT